MKEFACGYVIPGCEARFYAVDTRELLELCEAHARDDHGVDGPLPDPLVEQIREAARTVPLTVGRHRRPE